MCTARVGTHTLNNVCASYCLILIFLCILITVCARYTCAQNFFSPIDCKSYHTSQVRFTWQDHLVPAAAWTDWNTSILRGNNEFRSKCRASEGTNTENQTSRFLEAVTHPPHCVFSSRVPRSTIHPLRAIEPGLALFGPGRVSG